jgi:hypothetical protein
VPIKAAVVINLKVEPDRHRGQRERIGHGHVIDRLDLHLLFLEGKTIRTSHAAELGESP